MKIDRSTTSPAEKICSHYLVFTVLPYVTAQRLQVSQSAGWCRARSAAESAPRIRSSERPL